MFRRSAAAVIAAMLPGLVAAQEREDRTLLTQAQMTAIINEVSGERAMHHVLELVPYQRVRPARGVQRARTARAGSSPTSRRRTGSATSRSRPSATAGQMAWQPTQGELWMTTPKTVKLFDIHDIALALASLNANGDISGDSDRRRRRPRAGLRGQGRQGQVRALVGLHRARRTRRPCSAARSACSASAPSATSARSTSPTRSCRHGVNAQPGTVAWSRHARGPAQPRGACSTRGEKITIRSIVKSAQVPSKNEYVHAEIPGDGSTTQEVGDQRPPLRRRHQAGRQRRQLRLRAHPRDRPRVHQADRRGQAPAAEAHDQLPVGAGDLRHQRVSQRAPGQGEGDHRHAELRHGGDPGRRQPELLGAAAHARHLPVVPQRHRAEHDGVHRRHLARAGALPPPRRLRARPSRWNRRAAARTPSTSRSTSTTARATT